ncbi:MAG: SCP2 sterol-binding domain-containing protein [Myxococcales bacterium]|nr:SCP2 sterol-binding domain-containing protein [Myxococcales bacterium]
MPDIYTLAWYNALQDLLNGNPDVEKNAPRGRYKMLAELRGDGASPYVSGGKSLFFVVHFDDGSCTEYSELAESPPRKEFDFIFEFPASVFEGIAAAIVDPIEAGLKGTIKITGDMRILIRHADLVNVLYDVYAREVETGWPKGKPPYDA